MPARLIFRDKGRDLTDADRSAIETSFRDALRMAEGVAADMDRIWNQPGRVRRRRQRRRDAWESNTRFVEWFGVDRQHTLIRRTRRRIEKIRTWLDTGRIVVYAHSGGDLGCRDFRNAFARVPRRPIKVHLCPPWFGRSDSRRAAIVIHELTHELGFGHPEDTTDIAAARNLADSKPRRARRSPENYEHLYEQYF